jgi:hypothetical protein
MMHSITDPLIADTFFMENVWQGQDREEIQNLSMDLLETYVQVLSGHLELSVLDTHHLAREMGYHAISTFLDTTYRLKQKGHSECRDKGSEFQNSLSQFFSEETVQSPMGSSRILRCNLANLILQSLGGQQMFADINQDPQQIHIEDLNLPLAKEERYWRLHYNITERIPNGVRQYSKASWNQLSQLFRNDLIRIGSINLDRKYMLQLPDIQFVPLELNLEKHLEPVFIDDRLKLHDALKSSFISKIRDIKGWKLVLEEAEYNNDFLELLLAFIILQGESLLCRTERLHQAIDFCEKAIGEKELKALFSQGGWFRFQHAITAVAGRRLGLPLIDFQHGGAGIYEIGKGFEWGDGRYDRNFFVERMLVWGDWQNKEHQSEPKYHRVFFPQFVQTVNAYSKKTRINKPIKILYSPLALSNIFPMENWLSISSYYMAQHRSWINKILGVLDEISNDRKIILFIKIKGFGYTLFKDYPWMLFPKQTLKNVSIKYLFKGSSGQYLQYMDIHLFCGPSTTFAESMNINIPSVCLWNPELFKGKREYHSLVQQLNDFGIICFDQNQFMKSINLLINKNMWYHKNTQMVREAFCEAFASTSIDWKSSLNDTLTEVACPCLP